MIWDIFKSKDDKTLWINQYRIAVGSYFGLAEEEVLGKEQIGGDCSFDDPPLNVGLRLPKNEYVLECFENITLFKYKSDGRIGGHGLTLRVKVAKGLYYRAGAGRVGMAKSWQPDASGTLYITNKGILFDGDLRNVKLPWGKIIREEIEEEGLQFEKQTGDPLVFQNTDNSKIDPHKAGRLKIISQMFDDINDRIEKGEYPPKGKKSITF